MADNVRPRPEVQRHPRTIHGGLDFTEIAQMGLGADEVVDFSVNSNPFGPSPRIQMVWENLPVDRYPDRDCLALRAALASRHRLTPEQIWVGNGETELIWLLAMAYLRPNDPFLVIGPTFGEYAAAGGLMGGHLETAKAHQKEGFHPDIKRIITWIHKIRPRLTFLCNPNNPTGIYLEQADVQALLAANKSGLLVLDEAYVSSVNSAWSSISLLKSDRLVVLRSMTKDHALAGLRLGYLMAAPNVIDVVGRVQPSWSVNAVAQKAGIVALDEEGYLQRTLTQIAAAKMELTELLRQIGLRAWPSSTHFFLVETGDAAATRANLLRKSMLVRDCGSFGLPAFVRVSTRRPEENRELVAVWRAVLQDKTPKDDRCQRRS